MNREFVLFQWSDQVKETIAPMFPTFRAGPSKVVNLNPLKLFTVSSNFLHKSAQLVIFLRN